MAGIAGIRRRTNRGFALVTVLWLVVLLTVIATGLTASSRATVRAVEGQTGGIQARYLGEGAAQLVLLNLLNRDPASRMLADGETIELPLEGGEARVTVTDESGKIDINAAREPLLSRLFYSFDISTEDADALAAAIADYRDEDDLKRLNGAEDDDYLADGLMWGAKDAPFTSIEELRNVYGMLPWIYEAIEPYVTIYSRQQGINPEVAPLQVLLAVSDDSPASLESYIERRRQNHNDGLPLPPAPAIARQFLSRTRGITYSLSAVGVSARGGESGITMALRLRRGRSRVAIQTLQWQPYMAKAPETGHNEQDSRNPEKQPERQPEGQ